MLIQLIAHPRRQEPGSDEDDRDNHLLDDFHAQLHICIAIQYAKRVVVLKVSQNGVKHADGEKGYGGHNREVDLRLALGHAFEEGPCRAGNANQEDESQQEEKGGGFQEGGGRRFVRAELCAAVDAEDETEETGDVGELEDANAEGIGFDEIVTTRRLGSALRILCFQQVMLVIGLTLVSASRCWREGED